MRDLQHFHLGICHVLGSPLQHQQSHPSTETAMQDNHVVTHTLWSSYRLSTNPGAPKRWHKHITDKGMQLVCKLTKLQSLELSSMVDVTARGLASLHKLPGLKCLGLTGLRSKISASAVPAFIQLTALTCLHLAWETRELHGKFDPAVLAHMLQLEELHLYGADPAGGASGAAELLARLARLTKLEVLHLAGIKHFQVCPPAAYSSLTSSSVLRSLTWSDYGYYWSQPPGRGPWQHVFPDWLGLWALTELETAYAPSWEASDLDRLVSSCSRLQKLSLRCTPGLQLTVLLQLKSLQQLWLRGRTDSSTTASLAQLSALRRLQRLAITDTDRCSSSLFMPLTALTQLTYLALPHYSKFGASMQQALLEPRGKPSPHVDRWPTAECLAITSTAPAGAPPDVWSQLLSCCEGCAQAAQLHMGGLAAALEAAAQSYRGGGGGGATFWMNR